MKKSVTLLFSLFMFAAVLPQNSREGRDPDSKFVWKDHHGEGRQVYLVFRKDFHLKGPEPEGKIHLWAHSRYHLFVNGTFINFGPVRSYAPSPEYDSYDISAFLREGDNNICVKVLNDGMVTYQVPAGPGAFISWGQIGTEGDIIDLRSPGDWKVLEMKGYDPTSTKMTFATGALENYDARKDPDDIFDDRSSAPNWKPVTILNDQRVYGEFIPRTIPHLTQDEKMPFAINGLYTLNDDEDIYSFRVKSGDETRELFGRNKIAFAETYIFSPVDQTVNTGLWWGDYYVNGEGPLTAYSEPGDKFYRRDYPVKLHKGWNHFFVRYGIVWASWDFYMAVPKSAGLIFSPDKNKSDDIIFRTAGPFPDMHEESLKELEVPLKNPEVLENFGVSWVDKKRGETAGNPAFEIAWRSLDELTDHGKKYGPKGNLLVDHGNHVPAPIVLSGEDEHALLLDMGGKTLGRIYLDLEAPEGTVFNIAFTEDTLGVRPWVLKRVGLYTGARYTSDGGRDYFETFKPYGARFLQINIEKANGPVKLNRYGMISQIYPYRKTGSFICSDPLLNEIWEMGWRTLEVCSEDTYTDTPYRERGIYAGDALPQYAIALVGSGDSRLMKRSIRVFADMYEDLMVPGEERPANSVNHMADYPLMTLVSYLWSVAQTRDMEFAAEFYEGYRNMLDQTLARKQDNGLFDHDRAFIEWTRINKNAQLTTIQSLIAYCLESFSWLAGEMGYEEDALRFEKEAKDAIIALNEHCWDPEKGAFHDGFFQGEPIDHHYPISSAWPVMFGQTTPEQDEQIRSHFVNTLTEIGDRDRERMATPYGAFYLLEAMYKLGMTDFAGFFMRKYWSAMIYKHGDTAWENFGDGSDGGGQGTLSHAWSGHPTYFLSTRVLGVRQGFPDFTFHDRILIRPESHGLSFARGEVPHPLGLVKVDWEIKGDVLFLDYHTPDGIPVTVKPEGDLAKLKLVLNGRNVF